MNAHPLPKTISPAAILQIQQPLLHKRTCMPPSHVTKPMQNVDTEGREGGGRLGESPVPKPLSGDSETNDTLLSRNYLHILGVLKGVGLLGGELSYMQAEHGHGGCMLYQVRKKPAQTEYVAHTE
jgi:hypothetical protein